METLLLFICYTHAERNDGVRGRGDLIVVSYAKRMTLESDLLYRQTYIFIFFVLGVGKKDWWIRERQRRKEKKREKGKGEG